MTAPDLPHRHLSIRVPWHDTGWAGTICQDPLNNSACLRLTRISQERDDSMEVRLHGRSWFDLRPDQLPPCSAERAGFMAPEARTVHKRHPYASWNEHYFKFQPTAYEVPRYSAECIPFRWMLRKEAVRLAELYALDYRVELEDAVDTETGLDNPRWVQHGDNQRLLLDTFFSAIQPERSLCFIYAKEAPVTEDPRRVLIGVGRSRSIGAALPYEQEGGGFGSMLWERVIRHSIRPTMEDGFLLPYHQLLALSAHEDVDVADHTVLVPDEHTLEFSYASEHVSHDTAAALLLALDRAVEGFSALVEGPWAAQRAWLGDRLAEVWDARGPCPGLGAALRAFGIAEGVLLAHEAHAQLRDNEDPWPLVESWLRDPALAPDGPRRIGTTIAKAWVAISEERRQLLRLLSRFDLTIDQATRVYQPTERRKAGIELDDAEILANPYLLYETDRFQLERVSVATIDRGVFPADRVRHIHPLPAPSAVDEPADPRRMRALIIDTLEQAADAGDSLRSEGRVIQEIRDRPLDPPCPVSVDLMAVAGAALAPEVDLVSMSGGERAYQLARLAGARKAISRQVKRRRRGTALPVAAHWRAIIDDVLRKTSAEETDSHDDQEEDLARQEKAAALEVLATSRVSVLIGAAGTGKTTLLRALREIPEVEDGGLLLLAPTGKARVRMQAAMRHEAKTIAQLLVGIDRYDGATGRYHRSDRDRVSSARTVIVDECSMLTEEALDALLDGIEGYDRLILVGDPRQLPPIGVGRPFVDIIRYLRAEAGELGFPRTGPSYAELTIPRRQIEEEAGERADLLLAEWFAGDDPSPGADEVWDRLASGVNFGTVSAREWNSPGELHNLLNEVLAKSLDEMTSDTDCDGFELSYGGTRSGGYIYFNSSSAKAAEAWQVLSPVRGEGAGVNELNRMLQRTYREAKLQLARNPDHRQRKVPKPAGPQEIVYGDKVINVRNQRRMKYYPRSPECIEYTANGEMGVVVGPFRRAGHPKPPFDRVNVALSTQPDVSYDFLMSELGGDDSSSVLELAYAITIHKSQGSEFQRTFVVIPNPCRLLSRELIYTALTRQRQHTVILHQGPLTELRGFSSSALSETAGRVTNLFTAPDPVEVDGRFLESGLIHRTRKGITVRSKSELIIADLLYAKGIEFEYERPLRAADGSWRSPDFTIEDDTTGQTLYWEHLGMLQRPSYRRKWNDKLAWYRANGVAPHDEGGGPQGTLVVTRDGPDGSISSHKIEVLVDELLG